MAHLQTVDTRTCPLKITELSQRKGTGKFKSLVLGPVIADICENSPVSAAMRGDVMRKRGFKELLKNETIDEIVFGIPLKKIENVHEYIYFAEEMGKNVRVLPDFQINKIKYYPQTAKVNIEDFLGVTSLALSSVPKNTNELLIKAFIDYSGAAVGIVLLSPLFILVSLIIKLTSKGPVFFSQERSGLNGRRFMLHKFRSMVVNAEELREKLMAENEMDGPVFKMKKDPRITWIGAILRKTSMDELPQLFNVLKGEMSLVGPRPQRDLV